MHLKRYDNSLSITINATELDLLKEILKLYIYKAKPDSEDKRCRQLAVNLRAHLLRVDIKEKINDNS